MKPIQHPIVRYPIVLLALAVIIAGVARGQEINGEFEQWGMVNDRDLPFGWSGSSFGVGKVEGGNSGSFAASVWNWYYYGKGVLMLGENGDGMNIPYLDRTGVPISFKPTRLTGYYKYRLGVTHDGTVDSAMIVLLLKKFNPATRTCDTVGYATGYLMAAEEYTPFTIDIIDAAPGVQPDSIALAFVSSATGMCHIQGDGTCYYLSVDDVRLSASSGVSYGLNELLPEARVYPNPARGSVHVEWGENLERPHRLRVYGLSGRLVREIEGINGSNTSLDGTGLPPGEYLFDLAGDGGTVAARGRFVIR
jgi:hypothetical protein